MRQTNKTKKSGVLRKLFAKISRLMGYELIDQSDLSFVNSSDKNNPSIVGKKIINLPLGELKITRKIKSFHIILKTCTSVNLVSQNKKRIFERDKPEYTFRTINSLIKSLKKARDNTQNISFFFTIIDSGSSNSDLNIIESKMKNSMIDFNIESLNLDDYDEKIKVINKKNPEIERNMKSTMAAISRSFELTNTKDGDLIYFVEDDYIHKEDSIIEMIATYEKFSTIFERDIFLLPVDYPYLYQKDEVSEVLIGKDYHWRSVKESLLTFLTSKSIVDKYYDKLKLMSEKEHSPFETILHKIYEDEKCFSPIPSLAIHCTNVNSVFGLSPNINARKLWDQNES